MSGHEFLAQALVYLAAAVIAVPVFKRLGLGSVLGYLVAGVAIGPWGLGLVHEPEAILGFAEFGVVLLLFLVGLELNPRRLWELRRPILGLGSLQVTGTIGIALAAGLALGMPWTIALVAGMGFAMSSTAIALASLAEKNLLGTPGGQSSISVSLAQDLSVIPLMLVLAFLAPQKGGGFDWRAIAEGLAAVAAVIAGGRFLIRPLLRWIAGTGLREVFIAFSLMLVAGIALGMSAVGLSMALGAFLAGVLLADSEYRHELVVDIEPFKGLLLGLFFIAVGMSIDMGLFASRPLLVFGLAAAVVAAKIALLYPLGRAFGLGRPDAWLFALAISQIGEFAFVLHGVALTEGVLDKATADVLNAAVAASMLTTPLALLAYERVIAPRLARAGERPADAIQEKNAVIIAGFGRFGQVVARVLTGIGTPVTVMDCDASQIELVRRFGWKAYYGDASRLDLLESAGAAHAKLLVVAVDDDAVTREIVTLCRAHFPLLALIVRARGRAEAFEYVAQGLPAVRETFGSALDAAERALVALGISHPAARRIARRFRRHDEALLEEDAKHRDDEETLILSSLRSREALSRLLEHERAAADGDDRR